jgi:hypothetical protein
MPGHGSGAIVQNNQEETVIVEHGVHYTWYPRMEQRGIADVSDDLVIDGLRETGRGPYARSHAEQIVGHVHRGIHAEGVATDVGAENGFTLPERLTNGVEGGSMRTAGA